MKKNDKIVLYRRRLHLNIGVVIFAFVLVYFVVYLVSYLTQTHIAIYEVQKGQIVKNMSYMGLALRAEEVCYANDSGEVNYYKKEGDKAGFNDLICSVDKNGDISAAISQAGMDASNLSASDLNEIQQDITEYVETGSDIQFYTVYGFKDDINAKIQENLYLSALNNLSEQTNAAVSQNTFSFVQAPRDGVLAFYTDGYEGVTPDTFTADMYAPSTYVKNNLKGTQSVIAGQALYKIVNEEDWYIMVPCTADEKAYYQSLAGENETFVIRVTFKKDDTQTYATAAIREFGGQDFLQLSFNSSMVRFLSDRYLEIELGSENTEGLKIPNSAITEKDFFVIPKEYIGKGDDSSDDGVIRITQDENNKEKAEFIATDLFSETEDSYYVDGDSLSAGDTIQMPGSTQQYTVGETASLQGVYNINRGYAVFEKIEPLAQNEEYTIVKTGTSHGISMYDHIALDGSSIKEGEFARE